MNGSVSRPPWSDRELTAAIKKCTSWRAVLRELNLPANSAGFARTAQGRATELGLDTSHFRGARRWSDDQLKGAISRAKSWTDVLVELGLSANSGSIRPFIKSHAMRLGLDYDRLDARLPRAASPCSTWRPDLLHLREAGPSIAAAWFASCGCPVSVPLEPAIFDLLVSMPEGIKRVQVKSTASHNQHGWQVGVGRRPYTAQDLGPLTPYGPGELDLFFILDGDLAMYLIPSQIIAGRVSIMLRAYKDYVVGNARGLLGKPRQDL